MVEDRTMIEVVTIEKPELQRLRITLIKYL